MTIKTAGTTRIARATALATLVFALTACGGGGADGEFYSDSGQHVIDGSSVSYSDFHCVDGADGQAGMEEEVSATGELTEDGTQVMWSSDDEHLDHDSVGGTMPVTASDSGEMVNIGSYQFKALDKDEALRGYADGLC